MVVAIAMFLLIQSTSIHKYLLSPYYTIGTKEGTEESQDESYFHSGDELNSVQYSREFQNPRIIKIFLTL